MKLLPEKLLDSIGEVKGFDKASFIDAHTWQPITSIRKHPLKGDNLFNDCDPVSWCGAGRYLEKRPVFTLDPLHHAGAYYVQDASSMFLDHLLRSLLAGNTNLRVLDLCAAPGGKSTLIASLLDKDSLLVSNEVIKTRAPILEENISRWGYSNTWVTSNDARDFSKLTGYFDVIVVDAPCSGSGLFRKNAGAIDEWSEANVALCSQRQKRILADAWPSLKTGGLLVYATCSYSVEEDEMILDWIGDEFEVSSLTITTPDDWGVVTGFSEKHHFEGYRFFPDKIKGEGFFIAAVQKNEEVQTVQNAKFKLVHDRKTFASSAHLLNNNDWSCVQHKDEYFAMNAAHEADYALLLKHLYLRKTGVRLGSLTAKEWLPDHDIALSIDRNAALPVIDLDKQDALRFLKKESLDITPAEKGWYIMQFGGLGLGWIKWLGNRFNNYLPKNNRIRMDIGDAD